MDNSPLFSQTILENDDDIEIIFFNLSPRIVNALYRQNIRTAEDLKKIPNEQMLFNFKGIG